MEKKQFMNTVLSRMLYSAWRVKVTSVHNMICIPGQYSEFAQLPGLWDSKNIVINHTKSGTKNNSAGEVQQNFTRSEKANRKSHNSY
jgi:hypothetical protein